MDGAHGGRYELVGRGADLAIEVAGPDLATCLGAAVQGFAASVGHVPPDATRRLAPVHLEGDGPEALLVGLMDEAILRLDAEGVLAVALTDLTLAEGDLHGRLALVDLAAVQIHGDPPKAATWHDVRLGPSGDGWRGVVMLDL